MFTALPLLLLSSLLTSWNERTTRRPKKTRIKAVSSATLSSLPTNSHPNTNTTALALGKSVTILGKSLQVDSLYELKRASNLNYNKRRPRGYWSNLGNVRNELNSFWKDLNVTIPEASDASSKACGPIPNEALLNYYARHDLRWMIQSHGGRQALAYRLGGAIVIPGKWTEAVRSSNAMQQLLHPDNSAGEGLSPLLPPLPHRQQNNVKKVTTKKQKEENITKGAGDTNSLFLNGRRRSKHTFSGLGAVPGVRSVPAEWMMSEDDCDNEDECAALLEKDIKSSGKFLKGRRWSHKDSRKRWGYWNEKTLQSELYSFVTRYMQFSGRPAIFMPRLIDFSAHGRDDLRSAITRFGGTDDVCNRMGMIRFREWEYFESIYELLVGIKAYCLTYHESDPSYFPPLSEMESRGAANLLSLIRKHGGRKLLAQRFNMHLYPGVENDLHDKSCKEDQILLKRGVPTNLNFGNFSLDFALELLNFVRNQMLLIVPPVEETPRIKMPTKEELIANRMHELADQIEVYGGYENIARRLGLEFDD